MLNTRLSSLLPRGVGSWWRVFGKLAVDHADPVTVSCTGLHRRSGGHGGAQSGVPGVLSLRPGRPARHRDRAGRRLPYLVRPCLRRRGRVSGAVRILLRRQGHSRRAEPGCDAVAGVRGDPAHPTAGSRPRRGAGRLCGADHPGSAGDALGDIRRPKPCQPRLLPELGAGQHRLRLPAGGRSRQPLAAHLVDVGAGPVLRQLPGVDRRVGLPVPAPYGRPAADLVRGGADRVDGGLVRLRDHRASAGPGGRLLQQLRAGLGVAAGRAGGRAGDPRPLAHVGADGDGHRRAGRGAVLRGADRRRSGVPRPVGAGAGRRRHADDPGRRQPGRAGRPVAAAQSPAGDAPAGGTGRHGICAVPLALAAAHLLAVL